MANSEKDGGGGDGFFICPNCGAEIRAGSTACPNCGSDERTGWSEEAESFDPDLPAGYEGEESFNYDEFVQREFGVKTGKQPAVNRKRLIQLLVAAIAIAAFIMFFVL